MIQEGFFLITPDISGYSVYLHESELDHARDSLTDLLSILVEHSKSPLVISKLEEDAAVYEVGGCYKQKQKTWLHTLKQ